MRVNGKEVARKKMEKTIPITLDWDESQDIGSDTLTGVNDDDYKVPSPSTARSRRSLSTSTVRSCARRTSNS
jgi:arylsulfatase